MEIDRMLTLSTAHICQDTAEKMGNHLLNLTIYEKGKYGWIIYVGPKTAEKAGCTWLCLDCDGEKIKNLPIYEW